MAEVSDTAGLPTVLPQTSAPQDYQNISTNPDQFGAGIARGVGQLAQGASTALHFYGQVAANNATNQLQEFNNTLLNGDPSKQVKGPDGTMQPDTGFLGQRGASAMTAAPMVLNALDEKTKAIRSTLTTPEAQLQFDEDSRRYRFQWQAQIATHARAQQDVWAESVERQKIVTGKNIIGNAPENDASYAEGLHTMISASVQTAQRLGTDPSAAYMQANQDAVITRIKALLPTNAPLAQKVLDANRPILAGLPNYDEINSVVKTHVIDAQIGPATDMAVDNAKMQARASVGIPGQTAPPIDANIPAPPAGSRAAINLQNNNPGNMKVPGSATEFQSFPTREAGVAAVGNQIGRYVSRGQNTISQIVSTYAPSSENPTAKYIDFVSQKTGIDPSTPITASDIPKVRDAMIRFEQGGGSGGTAAPIQTYPTVIDALRGNYDQTLENARLYAEKTWAPYPDAQDRYVSRVQRSLDQAITQQSHQYEISTHVVQQALSGALTKGHPPTSLDQMLAINPQIAAAWQDVYTNKPMTAASIEHQFDVNSNGKAATYGTQFNDYLNRVLAPNSDPTRITDATKLWDFVQKGENSPLTNTGLQDLSSLAALRGTPQGEAFATQVRTFANSMHGNMTFTNQAGRIYDQNGEARYSKFMAVALPVLMNAQKSGTVPSLLNPKSPDYLGNIAPHFMRSPAQIMHDRVSDHLPPLDYAVMNQHLNSLSSDDLRQQALKDAVSAGKISLSDATRIGVERKWVAAPEKPKASGPDIPWPERDNSP